jgi:hypothetical protein
MIILINGVINAGKTTTGRQLAALVPRMAHVEVDALRDFVPFLPLAEAIPINLENAAAVTRNLVRHGFHIVLTYPLSPSDHAYLQGQFADLDTPIHIITLAPPLGVALTDRGARTLTDHERRRIREQFADNRHQPPFGITIDNRHQPPFGITIDNRHLTPTETATAILRAIGYPTNT